MEVKFFYLGQTEIFERRDDVQLPCYWTRIKLINGIKSLKGREIKVSFIPKDFIFLILSFFIINENKLLPFVGRILHRVAAYVACAFGKIKLVRCNFLSYLRFLSSSTIPWPL